MTAEEEIEEYGDYYCPRCDALKSAYKYLCDECQKGAAQREIDVMIARMRADLLGEDK